MLEPGYATPFRGKGERSKVRLLHGRPVRDEKRKNKTRSERSKRRKGWRSQRSVRVTGTVPYPVVDLSSARAAMLVGSIS